MKRTFAVVIAAIVWGGLLLQLAIMVNVNLASEGGSILRAISRFLAYFTILTNLLVAIRLTTEAFASRSALGRFFANPVIETGIILAIVTVGVIYVTVLQQLWKPEGPQLLADLILHYFTPLAFVGYWIVFVLHGGLHWRNALLWPVYPLAYAVYAMIRGAITGFYAYPFIDVATLGLPQVLVNMVALTVGFMLLGLLAVVIDHALGKLLVRSETSAAA